MTPSFDNPSTSTGNRLYFGHLGGTSTTGDHNSWFPEMWTWLIATFDAKSVLDVGCGIGWAQKFFFDSGLITLGIDCEQMIPHRVTSAPMVAHDLTKAAWVAGQSSDLVWCCEVAEHIDETFVHNVVNTLVWNCGKVLAFSAAPPGADGHHHVNCRAEEYWIEKMTASGQLEHSELLTQQAKKMCSAEYGRTENNYFRRSGLIFTRKEL